MRNASVLAVWIAMLVAAPASRADEPPAAVQAAAQLEPVTLLRDGAIAACGIKAEAHSGGNRALFALTLYRDRSRPTGTRMILSGSWTDETTTAVALKGLRFTTTQDLIDPLTSPRVAEGGAYEQIIDPEQDAAANAIREAMLSGATATLTSVTGAIFKITTSSPVSGSIRAAYLNCAGDLFRPEP
jgi:hypothetical protein